MNDPLLKIADTPATSVSGSSTVQDAVRTMVDARVGAVAVIDDNKLQGIFTERDLMRRVVAEGLDPAKTTVGEVMVTEPVSVETDTPRSEALDLMLTNHFRHLPITGKDGTPVGMLSIRNLLHHQVERMKNDMDSLEQYLLADGPGG